MSNEEIKEVEKTEVKECCGCPFCKAVKKILTIALGTFIGFYCAMNLFFAMHRPPMLPCPCMKKHHAQMEAGFDHGKFKKHHKMRPQMPQPVQEEQK